MHPEAADRPESRTTGAVQARGARLKAAARAAATVRLTVAALLALIAPAGLVHAGVPPPGTDVMRAAGSVEITVDGIGTGYVRLIGDVTIVRHPPDPGLPDSVPIEIVSLNLTGFSPLFGRVGITPCIAMPSTGFTRRTLGVESPSDSFFDVWYDISLPDLGLALTQGAYFRLDARTAPVPFFDVFTGSYSQMVPLVEEATGTGIGSLTHVALDPNPRVDILSTEARMDWTIGAGGGMETVSLGGRSVVVASESFVPPIDPDHPEFNTEIVAMDLTGVSPMWGDTLFVEQVMLHSPGRSRAANPGPPQFPADSFFDVFFDIRTASFDVFCQDPLTGKTLIDGWPPFGTPYVSSGPCPLFDRGSGQPMGTLDGFSWVWMQPAGQCVDADGDGVEAPPCGTDCDDNDPGNYPGNLENCSDQRDNNCNQAIDCQDPLCPGRPCDDGDVCTVNDRCVQGPAGGGLCQGAPVDCDDNDLCTLDRCDPAGGGCVHVPTPCDDGNLCTVDRCSPATGLCEYLPVVCDDGNQCTRDFCDPESGVCKFDPIPGATCDDGDRCTGDDRCVQDPSGGPIACQGAPVDCDDNNRCTLDSCDPLGSACVVEDNGEGTADLPPRGCGYTSRDPLTIIDGLPIGTTIAIDAVHRDFSCPASVGVCSFPPPAPGDCDDAGGSLGGEKQCVDSTLALQLTGTGTLAGFNRSINVVVGVETHAAPRTPGAPVQSFDTDLFRFFGQIITDPDFDLLRIVAGTDFGLPGPGHTILTQQAGGDWAVDSFFDITYRIDFVGALGGALAGMSGSTTGTTRLRIPAACRHVPVNCDDGNPCTIDRCNPDTGACEHAPVVCNDHDQCTRDSCDPASGLCRFDPTPDAPCNDGDSCTEGDRCLPDGQGGLTCRGTPVDCDDGDACTTDRCEPAGCIVPDNGTGTATLPPQCPYRTDPGDPLGIIDGLPAGATIEIDAVHGNFTCTMGGGGTVCSFAPPVPGVDCDQAGGSLGGDEHCSDSTLAMSMIGTGTLAGFNRMINVPVSFEDHAAPRTPGDPVQSFDSDMFRMFGQIIMDPDFDLLRVVAGTDFALPSPGHTTLTQTGGGNWAVDSFFDITYRIDFVGAPGGSLAGMSGSTTGTARFRTAGGRCSHTPVDCDDGDPCTVDRCNPVTGLCDHLPVVCDDGDQCTSDSCDPASGVCKFSPTPGAACDDGNACTEDDRCVQDTAGGVTCEGAPVNCDDGDACTADRCEPSGCIVPDNGTGTATLPPQCPYRTDPGDPLGIIDGLPAGTTIEIDAVHGNFSCTMGGGGTVCSFPPPVPGVDCDQAGGSLGGDEHCSDSTLAMNMTGTGILAGFNRMINVPVSFEGHAAPRTPGAPVQSFNADVFRFFGQIVGDPDFDLLRIVAGTDFGLPSPGHTILGQVGGGWAVDSFFDITYRIDFVGAPGGSLAGMSGSTTGTARFRTRPGGCVHLPVNCDDGDPCTIDRCNPVTGLCDHLPVVCDDGDQCTSDSCDPASGVCKFSPTPGAACDDGDLCTRDDRCVQDPLGGPITCQGAPVLCDDGNLCTIDRCDLTTGQCVFAPVDCSNGIFCDGPETCDPADGLCRPGLPPDCNDHDACTRDACDTALDACVHVRGRTMLGTDGSGGNLYRIEPATGAATLIGPIGFAVPSIAVDPATGTLYAGQGAGTPNLHTVDPDTGAATLVGSTGFAGAAVAGLAFHPTGRLYAAVNAVDDGGTGADTLAILDTTTGLGVAVGAFGGGIGGGGGPGGIEGIAFDGSGRLYGTSARQTASDPTAAPILYSIDISTGLATAIGPLLDGTGNPPAGGVVGLEFDADGTLHGGTGQQTGNLVRIDPATAVYALVGPSVSRSLASLAFLRCGCTAEAQCDDGNPCTRDSCDAQTGDCKHDPMPGEVCDDGDLCTRDDICVLEPGGNPTCSGVPVNCDDGVACTVDACDPVAGCVHQPIPVTEPDPLLFGSQTAMSWPATLDATHYNTYRGTIPAALLGSRPPGAVYDHACFESGDAFGDGALISTDATIPPPGSAYFYLESGEGMCGESDVGHASSGAVIPNPLACPTPP